MYILIELTFIKSTFKFIYLTYINKNHIYILDVLSPEDIERDIFEEKMEEQQLKELLTGEAEVLEQGIVG